MARRRQSILVAAVAATVVVAAGGLWSKPAAAVEVRGLMRVVGTLPHPAGAALTAPFKPYWEEWNGFLDPGKGAPDPAQVLSVVLRGKGAAQDPGCQYQLRGGTFAPTTMVVAKGSTLRIENTDGCSHELYADDVEGFQALQTAPGNARAVPVSSPGHFVIRDRLYPHVTGHVHVVDDLVACAALEGNGRFRFPDVTDGEYTLEVYLGERKVLSEAVEASGRYHTTDVLTISPGGE
jgi:hypothetical protein